MLALALTGCAPKKPLMIRVFKNCAQNGDHFVCTCERPHEAINAKTGEVYGVCE